MKGVEVANGSTTFLVVSKKQVIPKKSATGTSIAKTTNKLKFSRLFLEDSASFLLFYENFKLIPPPSQ